MIVVVVSLFVLLGACTHLMTNRGSEEALRQRVSQVWDAKVENNWEIVYDLATSEFRKKVSRANFLRGASLEVKEFSIEKITILESGKKAAATVSCKASHMGMTFPFTFQDTWLLEDDGWRLKLEPLGLPGIEK